VITAYPSFLLGHEIQYSLNEDFSLQFTFSFHFRKNGLVLDYNNSYYFTYSLLQLNTITYNLGIGANYFLTKFHKNKAKLLLNLSGGIAMQTYTSYEAREKARSHTNGGYFSERYFDFDGFQNYSYIPYLETGISVQSIIKKIGKIEYGIKFNCELKTLPEITAYKIVSEVNINGELVNTQEFNANLNILQAYAGLFFRIYYLNFEKLTKTDKMKRKRYKH
jgi:hypothetical protein